MSDSKKTILIPTDFTEQSLLAIKQSYNLARYSDSKIMILHVYEKQGDENYDKIGFGLKDIIQKYGFG